MRRDVIGTLRILNLISLAASRPGAPCQGSSGSVFQHFFCRFSGNIPHSEFLLSPCSLLHAPLRSLPRPHIRHSAFGVQRWVFDVFLPRPAVRCPWSVVLSPELCSLFVLRPLPFALCPVTPSASSMRSPLRVQSSHRLNSLTSLMLQFSLSLVRCPWSVVLSQNSIPTN